MADIKIAGRIKAGTADNIAGYASEILFDDEASNKTVKEKLEGKQDTLTFDNVPTKNSNNPVKSGGVYQAIQSIDVSGQISGKADKSEMSVVAGTGANADKTTITLKSGTSATVLTQHQDVSGKEDKSNKVTSFSSPTDTQYPSAKLVSDQLATKQNTISDLSTIRNGATAGATAIQSVTVGTTTTGAAGTNASVVNSGTTTAPVLSFTIPQGAQGIQGIQGIQGPQGAQGPKGDSGVTGDVSDLVIKQAIDVEETYEDTDIAGAVTVKTLTNEDLSNEEVIAEALVEFASYFNDGYYLKGVLTPSDEIGEQIGRVIFLAGKGTYENLNDNNTYVIEDGYIGLFIWDGTSWDLKKVSPTYTDSSTTDTTLQYSGEHISLQNTASYIKHMNLSPIAGSNGYEGRQGADCYGDYLFTFQKENATCQIYSLVTKQKVADVVVSGLSTTAHYNTVCFGTQKYDSSDSYPLLYAADTVTQVIRVQESNGSFTMSVVQSITCPYYGNFSVDGDCFWLVGYKISWSSQDYVNDRLVFKKYALPSVQEGDVTIGTEIDSFELPYIYCKQGSKILNGRMFISYGNTYVTDSVQVVDLTTHQQVAYVSLGAIAASGVEIEDVFFYKGNLGLCYMNMVYMLKFL